MASNLAAFVQYLGHSHIAIKSIVTGEKGAQEGHFQAITIGKAEDYIALRTGKRQLWINLQKLKPDVGRYIAFSDIESYKNVYIDLDCIKPDGFKDYAATEEERAAALSQLPILERWLQSHGLRCGLGLHTGNGAGMVLPIPETKAEPVFIAKLATFLKMVQADIPCTDPAMFDPPRVIGIPGTINAKLETADRKNQVREIVGDIPARVEDQALLSLIQSLEPDPVALKEWSKKYSEPQAQPETDRGTLDAEDIIDRLTGLFEYEPELKALLDGNIKRFDGDRSAAEYGVCGRLVKFGFTDAEINLIMCKVSKIGKWQEEGDHYRFEQTLRKLREAEAGKEEPKPESPTVKEIFERIKADVRALKDPAILAALAALKTNDPIEYDLLIDLIKKAHNGLRVATIHALIDKHISESKKPKEKPQDMPSDIDQAAQVIIDDGKAYEHIYKIWQKRVKGNAYLGKALLVSRGVQSCLNSKGLHIYAHGKHGHGKSEGMEKMIELVPPEFRMDEDVSPLAIHYASKNGMLLPGTTLLIDEMVWNDSLAGIIKRIITRFQKGAGHLTVIDGESVLVRTQPRLTIWTNSADLQADEQLRDRFQDEPITEGEDYVKDIIEFQKIRDTLPDSSEDVDRETAICQAILRDLATKTFTVKIPFATRIKIEASEGTRGYNIFSDLIKGLAAMRYAQRKTNEQGQLLATEADFKDAKDIYEGSKGHSEESYTTAEIRVLQAIIDHGYKALYKDIRSITGMSEGRIKDIVNGRGKDEQKRHGLRYKCSQLDVNTVDISIVIKGTYSDRVTTHPVELSLPSTFNVTNGIRRNLVTLDPDVERRSPDVDPDVHIINNSSNRDVVDVVKEEREEEDTSKSSMPSVERSIPSSKEKGQKTTSPTTQLSPIAKSNTSASTTPCTGYVAVKFKTPYQTDWQGSMRVFAEGEIADEVPQERADAWAKRGVVDIMEAKP